MEYPLKSVNREELKWFVDIRAKKKNKKLNSAIVRWKEVWRRGRYLSYVAVLIKSSDTFSQELCACLLVSSFKTS